MVEIYKDVIGYEGIYQVSNLGNVKSLKCGKEKQRKLSKDKDGYLFVGLSNNGIVDVKKVHQIVAESFLNHKRCGFKLVINHIDFDKANNRVENLEIVSARENCNKKHLKSSSAYTGVSWNKEKRKWIASIKINNKNKYLGYYSNELEASKAYQKELLNIS